MDCCGDEDTFRWTDVGMKQDEEHRGPRIQELCPLSAETKVSLSASLLFSSLELSDASVYEP